VSPSRERVLFMCVYERGNFEFEKDEGEIRWWILILITFSFLGFIYLFMNFLIWIWIMKVGDEG
jgi:multisubunit Na+/H+ antiporter MnhB subunit